MRQNEYLCSKGLSWLMNRVLGNVCIVAVTVNAVLEHERNGKRQYNEGSGEVLMLSLTCFEGHQFFKNRHLSYDGTVLRRQTVAPYSVLGLIYVVRYALGSRW